jgi:hypothetical protein
MVRVAKVLKASHGCQNTVERIATWIGQDGFNLRPAHLNHTIIRSDKCSHNGFTNPLLFGRWRFSGSLFV